MLNSKNNLPSDMVLFDKSKDNKKERLDDGQYLRNDYRNHKKSIYSNSDDD